MTHFDRAEFMAHLISELLANGAPRQFNNIDRTRFDHSSSVKTATFRKRFFVYNNIPKNFYRDAVISHEQLGAILKTDGLDEAYGLFQDQHSRDLFIRLWLIEFSAIGTSVLLNNDKYWQMRRSVDRFVERRGTVIGIPILGSLDLFNFNGIRLQAHTLNILNTFLLEQYRCARSGIGVRPSDVVVDAGGCWGDTSLYFAQNAGQVFCLECMPSNIKVIRENLDLNPILGAKISVIQKALWSCSREKFVFKDMGPGSHRATDGTGVDVETQTLDDFVSANSVERVDFIKMDIEGAEQEALIGAERTIRKHRPQLAISIYHDIRHFASIPHWIADLNLGYRLYLDHFTIHEEETVLFARSDS